jgi:hypothetical protein
MGFGIQQQTRIEPTSFALELQCTTTVLLLARNAQNLEKANAKFN